MILELASSAVMVGLFGYTIFDKHGASEAVKIQRIANNCGLNVRDSGKVLYECQQCAHQTSVTAGTIMHKSKLPLLTWFWAIYLVVHDKRGRSALALSDVLEINYRTALRLLRKIREAMRAQDANYQLSGLVEMDDAYFGGRKSGTDGRGTGLYRGKC